MTTYKIFYGCDEPFTVTALNTFEAKQKGVLQVEAKYPNRTIRPYDVVARQAA